MNSRVLLIFLIFMMVLAGCSTQPDEDSTSADARVQVTVSVLPQKFFVERIGGEHVTVNVMVATGQDPHTYEPKPEQMAKLANTDLYFAAGVPFEENWLRKFGEINPEMAIIDTSKDIVKLASEEDHEDEAHNEEWDPHTWTSPELVKNELSRLIYEALIEFDPENEAVYAKNYAGFCDEITSLQARIHANLDDFTNRKFMVYHPSWAYFADEFNLEQIAIEVGGTEPSASELAEVIQQAKNEEIQIIITQPEFSQRSAEVIAGEINGKVIAISPLDENWLEMMEQVNSAFEETFSLQNE